MNSTETTPATERRSVISNRNVLREKNEGAIADFLDGALPALHPGSPDPEMLPDDNAKGSRTLLYESQLRRLDAENMAGEEESHELLMNLMVEPGSLLARNFPLYHHDLQANVFGAPAGHVELVRMELSLKPDTRERAANCRAGIAVVLDVLCERGVELAVKRVPVPKWSDFQHTETAHAELWKRYEDHFRKHYSYLRDERRARIKATKAAGEECGYSQRQAERIIGSGSS